MFGARWEEVDEHLVWTHRLSKSIRGKNNIMRANAGKIEKFDLRAFPLVMDQLRILVGSDVVERSMLPASGPIIICELTERPWTQRLWRLRWREVAKAAGVPAHIQNRDSRPGAATEADIAGAPREKVKRLLGHTREETTEGYQRDGMTIRSEIARIRAEKRR